MCESEESMYQENPVLCASSAYDQKYYLNDDFKGLPDQIKDELKIICVLFTEDVGGVLVMEFEEDGQLLLTTQSDEEDLLYDEIGAYLKIKQLRKDKEELFEAIEMYYKVFFLEEDQED